MKKLAAVVINKGDVNAIGVVYNLGKRKIPVISLDSNKKNLTFYSRFTKKRIVCPSWENKEKEFINFLLKLGKKLGKSILFATDDIGMVAVVKHKKILEEYFLIPSCDVNTVTLFTDKKKFYKLLEKVKLPHAKTYYPKNISEVKKISKKIKYPCIVKPTISRSFYDQFRKKFFMSNNPEELLENCKKAMEAKEDFILQELIPGTEKYLVYTYINKDGEVAALSCYKKLRLNMPPYGNACFCISEWDERAVNLAIDILKKVNYKGIAEPEIIVDSEDKKYKLMEVNARTTVEAKLPRKCGINIEYIAYMDMLGEKISAGKQENGIKWWYIIKDIDACISSNGYFARKLLTPKEFIKSIRGKKEYAIFAWDDPLPFFIMLCRFAKPYLLKAKTYKRALKFLIRR